MVFIYRNNKLLKTNSRYINPWKGLMFAKKLKKGESVILDVKDAPSTFIHMGFVFQKLDLFCLDQSMKVVDVRKNIKPWGQFIFPKKRSYYYIESSPNSFDLEVGDQVKFEEKKAI